MAEVDADRKKDRKKCENQLDEIARPVVPVSPVLPQAPRQRAQHAHRRTCIASNEKKLGALRSARAPGMPERRKGS
jgi:hypothetical protein